MSDGRAQGVARVHWRLRLFGVAGAEDKGAGDKKAREALGLSSCFERVFGNLIVHGAYCVGNIRFHINLKISFQKC